MFKKIIQEIFIITFITFFIFYAFELIKEGFVSNHFDLNIILVIMVVVGCLFLLINSSADLRGLKNMRDCLFCKISKGEIPCHKIWEDEKHLAFLSIFPNTPGFSVVITKKHYPSYIFDLSDDVLSGLINVAKKVGKLIDAKLEDVGRTGLIAEGFGVDHAHLKLFPMHGTKDMAKWRPIEKPKNEFYEQYPGFISSHDGKRADDNELTKLAEKIRE